MRRPGHASARPWRRNHRRQAVRHCAADRQRTPAVDPAVQPPPRLAWPASGPVGRASAPVEPARPGQRALPCTGKRQYSTVCTLRGRPGPRFLGLRRPQGLCCPVAWPDRHARVDRRCQKTGPIPARKGREIGQATRRVGIRAGSEPLPSDDLETRNEVARLQAELAGVEKTARALEQAGPATQGPLGRTERVALGSRCLQGCVTTCLDRFISWARHRYSAA